MSLAKRIINACFLEKTVSVITFDGITRTKDAYPALKHFHAVGQQW